HGVQRWRSRSGEWSGAALGLAARAPDATPDAQSLLTRGPLTSRRTAQTPAGSSSTIRSTFLVRIVDELPGQHGAPPTVWWTGRRARGPGLRPGRPRPSSCRSYLAARPSGLVGLLEEVAGAVHIDRDTGTHGGGHGDLLDVAALRGGRLQTQDLVERGHVVLDQLLVGERDLADDVVQVRRTVGAE